MDRGVKLDGADHRYTLPGLEVPLQCSEEMGGVDISIDEDVEGLDLRDCYWNQTGMGVMND